MTEWWHVPTWQGRQLKPERWSVLYAPMRWTRKPRVVLVDDIFADKWTYEERVRVFAVMALCPQHLFVLMTGHVVEAREYLRQISDDEKDMHRWAGAAVESTNSPCAAHAFDDLDWPLPNLWIGIHAETQAEADERVPELLDTPAALRFVHVTPREGVKMQALCGLGLEDEVDALRGERWRWGSEGVRYDLQKGGHHLDWLIVEGGADPMHPDWARSLRDQCAGAGVPFSFAGWYASNRIVRRQSVNPENNTWLDGVEHNAFPEKLA